MDMAHIWSEVQTWAPLVITVASVAANGINAVDPQAGENPKVKKVQQIINWLALNFVHKK